jgi:hypothetical protein
MNKKKFINSKIKFDALISQLIDKNEKFYDYAKHRKVIKLFFFSMFHETLN